MTIMAEAPDEWRIRYLPGAVFRLTPYTLDRLVDGKWKLSVGFYRCFGDAMSATGDGPKPAA
jgi:hypothetical protein